MINKDIMKNEEIFSFSLRSLYNRFGYERYKMNKFEEYDLYVRNKDFLISDGVITFTDTNGKLLALKPDVTLSIIKNSKDIKGYVQKLYYDEHVYRISKNSHSFKEIAQTGLECIGDISLSDICEVVYLALMSLESISEDYILDLSHAGLMTALFDCLSVSKEDRSKIISYINEKNADGVSSYVKEKELSADVDSLGKILMASYKNIQSLREKISAWCGDEKVATALNELEKIYACTEKTGLNNRINIDFSIVSDISYYSGTLFKGYVKGIPSSVLSGGQYDKLMQKMGKTSGAIGFAVYLDMLERFEKEEKEYDFDTVILTDEKTSPAELIGKINEFSEGGKRVIALKSVSEKIRYRSIISLKEGENDD